MGAEHAHPLYVHGHSRVHRLAPEVKVASAVAFVFAVAVTPRVAVWAFAIHAALLVVVAMLSGIGPRFVFARLTVVVPFIAFAFVIPFIGTGERVDMLGISLSRDGLWATWNVVAKSGLGATASILLAATTQIPRLLTGMARLRVPSTLTMIASFMVRYLELLAGEVRRMRIAMASRGYAPRWMWQARPVAAAAGALFVRSYERGERVHAAMLSRGYTGVMPEINERRASTHEWAAAALIPAIAWAVAVTALVSPALVAA
jgi:cobalt/nickel transport system permease protein